MGDLCTTTLAETGSNSIALGVIALIATTTAALIIAKKHGYLKHTGVFILAFALLITSFSPLAPLALAETVPDCVASPDISRGAQRSATNL